MTRRHGPAGALRATSRFAADALSLLVIVFAIPLVVIAVGLPIAVAVLLVLRIGQFL